MVIAASGWAATEQRALLAVLLLRAGEVVSTDRLIDDLWGERPPPAATKALQAHISRLRKALDANGAGLLDDDGDRALGSSGGVLITRGHGYLLRVARGELDLDRFRGMVEEGARRWRPASPRRRPGSCELGWLCGAVHRLRTSRTTRLHRGDRALGGAASGRAGGAR